MATYNEIFSLSTSQNLLERVQVALAIAANKIRTEDPGTPSHDQRVALMKRALANLDGSARSIIWILLAQYADLSVAQIQSATDEALQAAVESALSIML